MFHQNCDASLLCNRLHLFLWQLRLVDLNWAVMDFCRAAHVLAFVLWITSFEVWSLNVSISSVFCFCLCFLPWMNVSYTKISLVFGWWAVNISLTAPQNLALVIVFVVEVHYGKNTALKKKKAVLSDSVNINLSHSLSLLSLSLFPFAPSLFLPNCSTILSNKPFPED